MNALMRERSHRDGGIERYAFGNDIVGSILARQRERRNEALLIDCLRGIESQQENKTKNAVRLSKKVVRVRK